jgi:hypothetical protein
MAQTVPIRQVTHRVFGEAGPYVRDPRRLRHYHDLLTPFGVAFDERLLARGGRNGFRAMSDALIRELPELPDAIDLVVVAHSTPDDDPMVSAAAHLAYICPGEARAFALSDHGVGAPFAALRVIAAHLATGDETALLVVLDQTCLPDYDERVHAHDVVDCAVAIVIAADGQSTIEAVTRGVGVDAHDAARLVRALAAEQPPATLVLCGPEIEPPADVAAVHPASMRHVCTAVWVELSTHLAAWRERYDRVLVVEYDAALRELHTATIALRDGASWPA